MCAVLANTGAFLLEKQGRLSAGVHLKVSGMGGGDGTGDKYPAATWRVLQDLWARQSVQSLFPCYKGQVFN